MVILGFNSFAHNAAACVMVDGRVVAAAEEERFSRQKNDGRLPTRAVDWCLREAGLGVADVDHVAFHWDPFLGLGRRALQLAADLGAVRRVGATQGQTWRHLLAARRDLGAWMASRGRPRYRFHRVRHHLAHAASAYLLTPYDDAAVLVIDGTGEIASTTLAHGHGHGLDVLAEVLYPHSLGYLFVALTHYLGFQPECDEYKLMSLASFGTDRFVPAFRELVRLSPGGGFRLDLSYVDYHRGGRDPWVSARFVDAFGPPRRRDQPLEARHADLARALQLRLEDVALHAAHELSRRTRSRTLCLAGGVALNAVMNGRLLREGPFERVYVQPVANDAGCSLGAAAWLHTQLTGTRPQPLPTVYLGPQYDQARCDAALDGQGLQVTHLDEAALVEAVAGLLAQGKTVGWFQGRMEMGPRALGNRSILADPRHPDMQRIVNQTIKHRESFRPFAPAVPVDDAATWFEAPGPLPYMVFVVPVRPERRAQLPAITHVDGTARVQTVAPADNPLFHRLLKAFGRRTGVPVLLNTSFNVMGEPIVASPADAVRTFRATDLDALVLGLALVTK